MKKLLIAVVIVIAVVGVAAVGAGYYVYRQLRSAVSQFAEFGQIAEIERAVRAPSGFVPPASEELTESQVDRFMRVQAQVRGRMGERFAEFEQKYKALSQKEQASLSDVPAVIAGYRDIAALWIDAKRTQVAALNDAGFSLDEYRWVRDQAYRAVGVPFVDLDIAKLIEDARANRAVDAAGQLRGAIGPAGPEANRRLIERFKQQLEANLALASFGL
jgi:hypothetical protein